MTASLGVPTVTSVRTVPARLLEINRATVNETLARSTGAKVSFTHLIAFAVLKGLAAVPAMNAAFVDGPAVIRHDHVGLGLAVDVEKPDGSRTLLVPVIKDAATLDFREFLLAYEDLVRRVHSNTLNADALAGASVTITNPGTLGTAQSVPRLMPGQGVIIGVGALRRPDGFEAADARALATLGVGSVLTLTSTYDHRIIQGAQSGLFLAYVAECLKGDHGFYEEVFEALAIPYTPYHWAADENPQDKNSQALKQIRVQTLINNYRMRGHLNAHLDPLSSAPPAPHPELDPTTYGLTIWDLDRTFVVDGLAGLSEATLEHILSILRDAYCATTGLEYGHILDPAQKHWIQEHVEGVATQVSPEVQRRLLQDLTEAEVFERFLHTRYVGQKRFGLEGAESTIVALRTIISAAADKGLRGTVLGTAHRGRLNVLANVVGKSYAEIFSEFEGNLDPQSVQGGGDVKYHKGASGAFTSPGGVSIPVTLASNPSHLEAVDPVVEGITRALQDKIIRPLAPASEQAPGPHPFLPVLVHGDAAFAGQGVVAETLNLSQLSGYRVGGTIHIVINNQVGFTTAPESARSSFYPTDVAKMIQAPIFHVNGNDPEAVARVAALVFDYRERFAADVVLDIVCYRLHGHNEGDDPSYTQPLMYKVIDAMRSPRLLYTEALIRRGDITLEQAEASLDAFNTRLTEILEEVRTIPVPTLLTPPLKPLPMDSPATTTDISEEQLLSLARASVSAPENFVMHPKLIRQFAQRLELLDQGQVDWTFGEALAIGTLVEEGVNVRLTGQDTRRGTFSNRHAALIDYNTGAQFVPLASLDTPGFFTVRDSFLSEYAAVGFEYGYSVAAPRALVAWEAQFGDFGNGSQIILDNFLVAGEEKWDQPSSLVMLLPHGYEGQGPEHSSARLERFLSLAARNNIRITQPSSAAQYFHLLRAQVHRERVTPLIVLTPKSLLRSPLLRSPLADLAHGSFRSVIDDTVTDPTAVTRVVLASGKIAHEALAARDTQGAGHVAVIRIEQLYPWPESQLTATLANYPGLKEVLWLQEEPDNMGARPFIERHSHDRLGGHHLIYVSRAEAASPATGSALVHTIEQSDLVVRALDDQT
jgi:2-oxoglutarate dehydrogenase E1 component